MTSPDVILMLAYRDGIAALAWLTEAFGFVERARMLGPDRRLAHGELATGSGVIMIATPTPLYEGPQLHHQHCERARTWSQVPWVIDGVLVIIADVDAHCERG